MRTKNSKYNTLGPFLASCTHIFGLPSHSSFGDEPAIKLGKINDALSAAPPWRATCKKAPAHSLLSSFPLGTVQFYRSFRVQINA